MKTPTSTRIAFALIAALFAAAVQAQDSAETIAEQDKARAAESSPQAAGNPQAPSIPNGPADPGPLFAGVDDPAIDAVRIDVMTNAFTTAFNGVDVWGAAYDAGNDRVLFNDGSVLWEWPVGGAPNMLGTITNVAGAAQAMVSLAFYNGTLYGSKNIAPEAIHEIDVDTLVATVFIDYDDGLDIGGLAVDQSTGEFYGTDDGTNDALVRINPNASVDVITPYPVGEADVDGLAFGEGVAYMVTDNATGPIYVYDVAGAAYQPELTNPWPTSETFAGGAWIGAAGGGGDPTPVARFQVEKIFNDGNPGDIEVTISCNTGLPLQQDAMISQGNGVNFVVTDFADGTLNCEVVETAGFEGYAQEYDNGTVVSSDSCVFEAVVFGAQESCGIVNTLQTSEVVVTKEWIDENPQFNPVNFAEATYTCANEQFGPTFGNLEFFGNGDTDSFDVYPHWDGTTTCSVTESLVDGGVEADSSDCQGLSVTLGNGASCTIVNTRLYEGIPTLSQYGLGLLALLMLGMGFVAFRRFA